MKNCNWIESERGTDFFMDGQWIGTAVALEGAKDTFAFVEDGVVCWTRTTSSPVSEMTLRYEAMYESVFQMVPAVQYDENKCAIQDYIDVRNATALEDIILTL